MIVIIMGVAGCGKTSVGELLAGRLGWPFLEGDNFHSDANRAKMAGGTPLTDEDRWPWLDTIGASLCEIDAGGGSAVLACSALKRVYRDRLRAGLSDVRLIHLTGSRALLGERIGARKGHYMPPALLDSQLATLEPPQPDEAAWTLDIAPHVPEIVDDLLARLA